MPHRRSFAILPALGAALLAAPAAARADVPIPGCDQFPEVTGLTGEGGVCLDTCCASHDRCLFEGDCLNGGAGSAACAACDELMADCGGLCSTGMVDCATTECGCQQARCFDFRCPAGAAGYCAADCDVQSYSPCMRDHPGEMMTGGTASMMNVNWNGYNMGYRFRPNAPATVTALGGLYAGTKTVRVYDQASNTVVASAVHTSANTFSYTAIPAVALTAGRVYTVAVWVVGGGAQKGGFTNPTTVGPTTITCAGTYGFNEASTPWGLYCFDTYYGMADVELVYEP